MGGGWRGGGIVEKVETLAKQLCLPEWGGLVGWLGEGLVWTNFLDNSKIFLVFNKLS